MSVIWVSFKGVKQLFNADKMLMAWPRADGYTQIDCADGQRTIVDQTPDQINDLLQPSAQHYTGPR